MRCRNLRHEKEENWTKHPINVLHGGGWQIGGEGGEEGRKGEKGGVERNANKLQLYVKTARGE